MSLPESLEPETQPMMNDKESSEQEVRATLPPSIRAKFEEILGTLIFKKDGRGRRVSKEQKATLGSLIRILTEYNQPRHEIRERLGVSAGLLNQSMKATEMGLNSVEKEVLKSLETKLTELASTRIARTHYSEEFIKIATAIFRLYSIDGIKHGDQCRKFNIHAYYINQWSKKYSLVSTHELVPDFFPKVAEEEFEADLIALQSEIPREETAGTTETPDHQLEIERLDIHAEEVERIKDEDGEHPNEDEGANDSYSDEPEYEVEKTPTEEGVEGNEIEHLQQQVRELLEIVEGVVSQQESLAALLEKREKDDEPKAPSSSQLEVFKRQTGKSSGTSGQTNNVPTDHQVLHLEMNGQRINIVTPGNVLLFTAAAHNAQQPTS